MKIFSYLYEKSIAWSSHPNAHYYLGGVSFIESSFFPIPPDVMLVTMTLAKPHKVWYYALIATLCSVAGGLLGYAIGCVAMMLVKPLIMASAFAPKFQQVVTWFDHFGMWMVILAGFTPFPYKVFTISAGMMHMSFPLFFFGSIIGRGLRFFLVCGILYFAAERFEKHFRRYIDIIGWSTLAIAVGTGIWMKWLH
jgi:membrane protein YqaA with SNARE-associated domain